MKKIIIAIFLSLLWSPKPSQAVNVFTDFFVGINYGPFHNAGQTPGTPVSEEQIKTDLQIINKAGFKYIRTYGLNSGLDKIITVANQYFPHLKICIGVYESSADHDNTANPSSTKSQLIQAVSLANTYDNVVCIVVGNECLQGDPQAGAHWVLAQTVLDDLAYVRNNLDAARKEQIVLSTALTYAAAHGDTSDAGGNIRDQLKANYSNIDVWMINIYPFFKPGGIESSEAAINENLDWNYQEFNNIYASTGRPIIISETGWPSAGSSYGLSIPNLENQRAFTQISYQWFVAKQWSGFLFEMFDEPWKTAEGDTGPHWGLYDKDGQTKLSWQPANTTITPFMHLLLNNNAE
ncbi:MAG: glycosyl hydrolase family 17 protein [Candidatus Electrothrix communis]|nr:MAG: glycosyl hydrolase family 17 protein [Candidatus Electrothrix communis]